MKLQVRIQVIAGEPAPDDDDQGERLVALLQRAVVRGSAPPVAVVVRPERTDLVELRAPFRAGVPIPRLLGALTRSTADGVSLPVAVGLMGRLRMQKRGSEPLAVPSAHVFLEWPDNRWWHHRALLDAEGQIAPDTVTVRRAIDGDALPNGLGRWWSWARRTGTALHFGSPKPPTDPQEHPLVH